VTVDLVPPPAIRSMMHYIAREMLINAGLGTATNCAPGVCVLMLTGEKLHGCTPMYCNCYYSGKLHVALPVPINNPLVFG
jgi:hypothetical protein